jgi:hypothetical protein
MGIIFEMTGSAGRWGTFELTIGVTQLASDRRMLPGQLEICQVVVKLGRFPAACRVTALAVLAKTAFVRLILGVAVDALDGGIFQISQIPGIEMAFGADQILVEAGQGELCPCMVKILPKRFNSIMASHAI